MFSFIFLLSAAKSAEPTQQYTVGLFVINNLLLLCFSGIMRRHIPEIEQLRGLEAGTESVKESTGNVAGKTGERELFSLCCV